MVLTGFRNSIFEAPIAQARLIFNTANRHAIETESRPALIARRGANLDLHQPLGREGDHVEKHIGVGSLLHERAKVHHLVGRCGFLAGVEIRNPTLPQNRQ